MEAQVDAPVLYAATNIKTYSFTLSWSRITDATSYRFYVARKNTSNGTWEYLTLSGGNTTTGTSADILVPSTNADYKCHVVAVKNTSISVNSNEVFLKTKLITPKLLDEPVSVETQKIVIQWQQSSYATDYLFYIKEVASGKMIHNGISSDNKVIIHIYNLESGLEYEYWVKAINTDNESDISLKKRVTTLAKPIPVALTASNITTTSLTARWNSVAGAIRYRLEFSDFNVWRYMETTNLSLNITNLIPNKEYEYRVRAMFGWSDSNYEIMSYYSNTISTATKPEPPVATTASNITETSFTATWQPVQGAIGYKLWVISSINTGANPPGYFPKTVVNSTCLVENLQVAHSYQYFVQVITPNGESAASNTIDVDTKPLQPTTQPATGITSTSFDANWSTTIGATSYLLRITDDETQNFIVKDLEVFDTRYRATGLKSGSGYRYSIRAKRNNTVTDFSNWALVTTAPPKPLALSASNITKTSFTASWQSAKGATHYLLFVMTVADNRLLPEFNKGLLLTGTSYQITGLTPNTEYAFYVYAVNNYTSAQLYTKSDNESNHISLKTLSDQPMLLTLTLTPSPVAGGTVTGGGSYASGSTVTIEAIPNSGFKFVNWTDGLSIVSTTAKYSVTVNANRTLTANFTPTTLSEITQNPNLKIFPNPVANILTISGLYSHNTLKIISLQGNTIAAIGSPNENEKIDFSKLQPGIYFIRIYENNKFSDFKILKR